MSEQVIAIIHHYIGRYIKITGTTPTPEHLARLFEKPICDMRLALASYLEARTS